MKLTETPISGVWTAESGAFRDNRGAFSRLFCAEEEKVILGGRRIVQINHSLTRAVGAVRGMHFQKSPHAEMKIVRCLRGRVLDVAVDLRKGSPTFLKWTSVELAPENRLAFIIPEGCAHGFQVLEHSSELLYLHTAFYTPIAEGAVRFDDPAIGIDWPLPPTDLSARDLVHPRLDEEFEGISV
ncbi:MULTISPECIES: dTDP-4-dehydrorhamnose 3,5-epimerase family protein [unclassified Bradyrhizobium]|uniref:dTDP-4-dehydrorhamnose 3,5-epimerase family protein n=1 Tax=unclassified Bradyrhizobium TaxID=2631580 RepID=UPI001FF82250|nr:MULTISPECIES: dTDP-4-dehydrorhamnose 3,5-epimerase family protein [unclassified Bradyrhizobium]MCK1534622.1 dTDP-4-dehydrorhamnose 3,5-epimerase family protein [Bradyrhizobium sp. 176]MCK1557859.1 dTDP-4-dehydrorhamnose 3,5-epimerase family protein [Bradyrhizobium sp. 171]UPJ98290.1 dTDP-4-dehydrorhamnose 3,5-epimerase family protein [Bradyrhizobium sp. 172]